MQMQTILDRITARRGELGLSEAAVAVKGGSRDMIRNWRRAIDKGQTISARYDSLALIAKALHVSEDWLIHGKGGDTAPPPIQSGMAEDATPFILPSNATRIDDPQAAIRAIFGTAASTPALFRVTHHLPAFEIAAGDVLLADMARLPAPGKIAVARILDDQAASASTMVCRYLPPYLVAADMGLQVRSIRIDDPGVSVRFPVVGSIRGIPPD